MEMSSANSANITELMTSHNSEVTDLPDNLKCAKCKSVLKDACQMPCGCRFCRVCIDDMMASGGESCPGISEECVTSPLSVFSMENTANKNVSRLTVKCAHAGCVHECQLADFETHLRECKRKNVECPSRELGCKRVKLAADEIDGSVDARFDWLLDIDLCETDLIVRKSDFFIGKLHPYKYRLSSWNDVFETPNSLLIRVRIYRGPIDEQLAWPFEGQVVITVADRDRLEACRSISLQCRIERPPTDNVGRVSDPFVFVHSELREAGVNLDHCVRVSCEISPMKVGDVIPL